MWWLRPLNSYGSLPVMTMFLKTQQLTEEQKVLLKHALFSLQKEYYQKYGEVPTSKRKLIDEIATTLHLRHEDHR